MAELRLVEAVNRALARAMQDDPAVIVLGEDVGRDGGVFRATEGLVERSARRYRRGRLSPPPRAGR